MADVLVTVFEGDPLPTHAQNPRVLLVEDVPWGTGTATRRRYTVLVTDGRYWLSEEERWAIPLYADGRPEIPVNTSLTSVEES